MSDASYNPPSLPAEAPLSLAGVLRQVMDKLMQGVDDMLPAEVVAYDAATNRARVRPLVMLGTTDGQQISRAEVASIPVFRLGAGGGMLSFPIKAGDLGWIKASDRDLSLFLQSYAEAWPNTRRMHSFQDALFFPDAMRRAQPEGDEIVLEWEDGSGVRVGPGSVKVTATAVELDAATTTITGNLNVGGVVTGEGGGVFDGVNVKTHTHGGVTSGSSNTAPPNP